MSAQTYRELVTAGAERLETVGIEAPLREARLLMQLAAEITPTELIARERDEIADGAILARYDVMLARREAREPFAHIAGRASFYGLEFSSDARALIPRADSEIVVEMALQRLPRGKGVRVADLGTGSGCLLIAILKAHGGVRGQGVEIDPRAAGLALENIRRHELAGRAKIIVSDWQSWKGWEEMDLILANPPYIASAEIETLQPEVRSHDPIIALDGGEDGLDAYKSLTALGISRMKSGAWLVLEIGYDQCETVMKMLQEAGFIDLFMARDHGGNARVLCGKIPVAE